MYTFKNTEINNKKASDFETKSMLYLLGMRSDSKEIDLIAVDCFNDVTGLNTRILIIIRIDLVNGPAESLAALIVPEHTISTRIKSVDWNGGVFENYLEIGFAFSQVLFRLFLFGQILAESPALFSNSNSFN